MGEKTNKTKKKVTISEKATKKITVGESRIKEMITHMEEVINVAHYLQDTRIIVGNVYCRRGTALGYDRIWKWVQDTLSRIENRLVVFLADYKEVVDQMK